MNIRMTCRYISLDAECDPILHGFHACSILHHSLGKALRTNGIHKTDDVKDKSVKTRVKTSLRKASSLFHIIGNVIISHETIRRYVPPALPGIMESFLTFVRNHRKGVFMYLQDPKVEKISDKAEQHFSVQSWLLKHRFKTKEGLIRTSYWYHRYLSTG